MTFTTVGVVGTIVHCCDADEVPYIIVFENSSCVPCTETELNGVTKLQVWVDPTIQLNAVVASFEQVYGLPSICAIAAPLP